jgi:hypothetical protein
MTFAARVSRFRAALTPRRIAAVGLLTMGVLAVAFGRFGPDRGSDALAAWFSEESGFHVAFPEGWQPVRPSDLRHLLSSDLSPNAGSSFSRAAGGRVARRSLSAQVFSLGQIPGGLTTFQASLTAATRIDAPSYSLFKPSRMASGAYLSAYRVEISGNPATTALIVVRGRNSNAFMISVTGDREDEDLLMNEARAIAGAIRLDGRILNPAELFLHEYLDIPAEAGETTRHRAPSIEEQFVSNTRLMIMARLDRAATFDECRAGLAQLWPGVLGRFLGERHRRKLRSHQLTVSCPASTVELVYDLQEQDFVVRQYDGLGNLVYEKDMTSVAYSPAWGRNTIA